MASVKAVAILVVLVHAPDLSASVGVFFCSPLIGIVHPLLLMG